MVSPDSLQLVLLSVCRKSVSVQNTLPVKHRVYIVLKRDRAGCNFNNTKSGLSSKV